MPLVRQAVEKRKMQNAMNKIKESILQNKSPDETSHIEEPRHRTLILVDLQISMTIKPNKQGHHQSKDRRRGKTEAKLARCSRPLRQKASTCQSTQDERKKDMTTLNDRKDHNKIKN